MININSEIIYSTPRGRPPLLTDDIKRAISNIKKKYPTWSANRILKSIHQNWINAIKDKHPDWTDEQIDEKIKLPGVSTVGNFIREEFPKNKEYSEWLDQPFQLGLLHTAGPTKNTRNYKKITMPPEALPYIIDLQSWILRNNKAPLTIRQSIWASRLYPFVCKKRSLKDDELNDLWAYVGGYAWYEMICDDSNTKLDTTILDEALMGVRSWRDALYILSIPIELSEGFLSPGAFAWLLQKTKDDPEGRDILFNVLNIEDTKGGEK